MFSTHLSCPSHSGTDVKAISDNESEYIDLSALTNHFRAFLPANYPKTSQLGYSEDLGEDICSRLFSGHGIESVQGTFPKLFKKNIPENFSIHTIYDIDSFISKAKSLAIAKHGIRVQFCPTQRQNISQNIHLSLSLPETTLRGTIKHHHIPLHNIPHFRLGTIFSSLHIPLFVFFPRLYKFHEQHNSYISDQTLQQWFDIGFLPSLHKHYSSDILQHLPTSFVAAKQEVHARSKESGLRGFTQNSDMGRRQELHYFLPGNNLDQVWNDLLQLWMQAGYIHFQDMFLLLDAKDFKLITKANSPKQSGEKFWHFISQDLNSELLDSEFQFLDIGQEICTLDKNRVLLYKRCCIDRSIDQLKNDSRGLKSTTYTWALNSLSANNTLEYSHISKFHEQGLRYSQRYTTLKCLFDAGGCYPLQNQGLEYLSLSPELIETWQSSGPGGIGVGFDINKLKQAFVHSRDRILTSLQGAMQRNMSFGLRQEHRVSILLFNLLCLQQDQIHSDKMTTACWNFHNLEVFQYLETNFLRFSLGLEYTFHKLQKAERGNTRDLSRIFRIFLHLQKASFTNVLLETLGDIWRGEPRPNSRITYSGLGLQRQLERWNVCWLEADTINWRNWTLGEKYQNTAAFEFIQIHSTVLHKTSNLLQQKTDLEIIDQFGIALEKINNAESYQTYQLLAYMGTLVLQSFRGNVWTALERFCQCQWQEQTKLQDAKEGKVPLDYESVMTFNSSRFTRVQFSNKHKYSLQERWEILFHWGDNWEGKELRKAWSAWHYRRIFQKCYETIARVCGESTAQRWEYQLVQNKFARTNGLLPSPCRQSLLQRQTRKGEAAKIYWMPICHKSWEVDNEERKLPARDQKEDRWEYWECDYNLPIPDKFELSEKLYGEDIEAEEMLKKVLRRR